MEDRYIGKMLDDRYEILDILGVGGMAVVYKAKCHRLNRMVAVKILKSELAQDDEIRRRFHNESQAVGMMSHPNIVNVYDVSQSEGVEYFVMELIDGITLKQYMSKRGGILNWREGLHFMNQILQALKHAHSKGIIHRDIKPQNIMVLRDGSIKVADFGIARIMDSQRTMTQESLGSVHYISPEQAKGGEIDGRSDLYSAGVVLYEMLTGRLPFEGDSPVAVALQHINCIPLAPREQNPEIPAGMEQIIMKAMAPDRDLRYADADAMLADLEEFRKNPAIVFPYEDPWKMSGLSLVPTGLRTETALEVSEEGAEPTRAVPSTDVASETTEEGAEGEETDSEEDEEEKGTGKRTALLVGGVVAAILLVVALIFRMLWPFFSDLFETGTIYTVPDLIGMTQAEAQEMILNDSDLSGHFTIVVSDETAYNEEYEEGEIILQDPDAGTTTKEEETEITVVLNSASAEESETMYMPNIIGENYETWAETLSSEYRVVVKYVAQYDDDVAEGNIISTDPVAGTVLEEGDKVTLTYSIGPKEVTVTMVSLIGMTQSKAESTIEEMGLTVGNVVQVESDETAGTVVAQSVKSGETVTAGTTVDLQISSGPATGTGSNSGTNDNNDDDDDDHDSGDDDKNTDDGDDEEEDVTYTILINMPDNRTEESVIVVVVNGQNYFTKTVGVDESVVRVNYSGTIESIQVTVDGEDYKDFTME